MHRRQALKIFAGLTLCPLCGAKSFGEETHGGHHWSYEGRPGLTSGAVSMRRMQHAGAAPSNRRST